MMNSVAIIGAGLMGHGLALVFAERGFTVKITDSAAPSLASVKTRVAETLSALGQDATKVNNIFTSPTLQEAVKRADLVIEAVSEKLALKQQIFKSLEEHARPDAILASNTSVIPIGQIAAHVKSTHRVVGTHWWNPPYLVPLVEVIQTAGTSVETVQVIMKLLKEIGKVPVHVKKDVAGFVGNRLQHALWREAISLVEDGVCDAETVDLVVKNSFGRRLAVLGPLENADLVGTDLTLDIQEQVLPYIAASSQPSSYLRHLVESGNLGFKSGQGFRSWTEEQKQELRSKVREHLTTMIDLLDKGENNLAV